MVSAQKYFKAFMNLHGLSDVSLPENWILQLTIVAYVNCACIT